MIYKNRHNLQNQSVYPDPSDFVCFQDASCGFSREPDRRLPNCYSNYLAQQNLEEDLFVDQIEMDEILGNKNLIESLRKGFKGQKKVSRG